MTLCLIANTSATSCETLMFQPAESLFRQVSVQHFVFAFLCDCFLKKSTMMPRRAMTALTSSLDKYGFVLTATSDSPSMPSDALTAGGRSGPGPWDLSGNGLCGESAAEVDSLDFPIRADEHICEIGIVVVNELIEDADFVHLIYPRKKGT